LYTETWSRRDFNASVEAFDMFHEDSFVLKLDSDELRRWNTTVEAFLETSDYAPSDWRIFRPHVSLFYGYKHRPIPKFENSDRINIKFNLHIVTKNSWENVVFKRKSDVKTNIPNMAS
jgi:hypothetical protein